MRFKDFLKRYELSYTKFGSHVGMTPAEVRYYARAERWPGVTNLHKIWEATDRLVTAQDFFLDQLEKRGIKHGVMSTK